MLVYQRVKMMIFRSYVKRRLCNSYMIMICKLERLAVMGAWLASEIATYQVSQTMSWNHQLGFINSFIGDTSIIVLVFLD